MKQVAASLVCIAMIHVICFFPVADCPCDNQSQLRSDVILKSQDVNKLTNQTRLNYVTWWLIKSDFQRSSDAIYLEQMIYNETVYHQTQEKSFMEEFTEMDKTIDIRLRRIHAKNIEAEKDGFEANYEDTDQSLQDQFNLLTSEVDLLQKNQEETLKDIKQIKATKQNLLVVEASYRFTEAYI
ncbi:unnamed protein product [Mytilus edulis]|uniref:Uncharacterized protein n=1 Tax=Mytilus edulis TaxID=6550 RepID=A0A8S3PRU3_MYTED|nr:unnamed protein product [Mytilus edulis]